MQTVKKEKISFTCKFEKIESKNKQTDEIFLYARWLQKNNLLKKSEKTHIATERLYRIAAENGNLKAIINLLNGAITGNFNLTGDELLRFSQVLIDENIAS